MAENDDGENSSMGGMAAALARAEAAVAALSRDYLGWAKADLAMCRQHLDAAVSEPADRQRHVTALFAIAHNIKGQGSSFGYPLMTRLGQSLCRLTKRPRSFSQDELTLMDSHVKIMTEILQQEASGEGSPALRAVVLQIEADVNALSAAA
jgi:chemotaxis protein histidine kinase CheA